MVGLHYSYDGKTANDGIPHDLIMLRVLMRLFMVRGGGRGRTNVGRGCCIIISEGNHQLSFAMQVLV